MKVSYSGGSNTIKPNKKTNGNSKENSVPHKEKNTILDRDYVRYVYDNLVNNSINAYVGANMIGYRIFRIIQNYIKCPDTHNAVYTTIINILQTHFDHFFDDKSFNTQPLEVLKIFVGDVTDYDKNVTEKVNEFIGYLIELF